MRTLIWGWDFFFFDYFFSSLESNVESTDNQRDDILSYNDNVMGILKYHIKKIIIRGFRD